MVALIVDIVTHAARVAIRQTLLYALITTQCCLVARWVQVPLPPLPPGAWTSLVVDMRGLVACCFAHEFGPPHDDDPNLPSPTPAAFAALDGIAVSGVGRLRRIFTLRDAPLREVRTLPYLKTLGPCCTIMWTCRMSHC